MQSTILVPRLAAAAFAIGAGLVIGSNCATASADSSTSDSSSSSSHAAAKSPARATASGPKVKAASKTRSAHTDRVTPVSRAAAARKLHAPSPITIGVDVLAANLASILGYAPNPATTGGVGAVLPLRTMLQNAVDALRRQMDTNPANGVPALHPKELYQFVTGEVLGDLLPTDPDGNKLTYQVIQGPTNGTLTINPNGTYYYKPNDAFAEAGGIDTAVVVADDGQHGQTVVPVNITVKPTLGVTERFWFRNYTLAPLKFNGYVGGTGDLDGGPAVGTVILPGNEASWDVNWYMFRVGDVTTNFGTVGFGYTPSDFGYVPAGYAGTTFQVRYETKPRDTSCAAGGNGQCDVPNDRMAIAKDNGSPVITLNAEDAAKIAKVLPNICYDGSQAGCNFTAKSQTAGFSPVRTVGTPVSNTTSTPTTYSIAIADQVSQSDTVGISVKLSGGGLAKLASIINIEITGTYSHTWVKTNTFTQTMNVPVAPGKTAWIEGSVPVWNVTGDFTIKIGNSTYQLNGATFTTPNPNEAGSYVIRDKPITSAAD
ncbi:Ig-like domain-containing protein [Mycobacterium sp. RTGN5]|uniref:Ig-like domain-containing protein n=1 Tax=Mycobacterium sp. RTGN5 TaxID=3016522 RepID=UPI0029C70499|nr:Ig-like domain-containing protein [Mycobacterium sp. RTGN5]